MSIKYFKPTSPGRRGLVLVDRSSLHKGRPVKSLVQGKNKKGGRDNYGHLVSRRKGGGAKSLYRLVDFKRIYLCDKEEIVEATVIRLEYDPNRSAFICLIKYADGFLSYIIAPDQIKPGDKVFSSCKRINASLGACMPIGEIPIGRIIHNVELKQGKGGQLARSAGSFARIVGRDGSYVQVKISSSEVRLVHERCRATVGIVSNIDHMNRSLSKAGRSRLLGRRPSVRGVAMNPVDHPHGGGEGKSSGGRHPSTPWGIATKGKKTRRNKFSNKFIVKSRNSKKGR